MANLNNTVRKKQYLLVGGLMAVIMAASMIVVYTKNNTTGYQTPVSEKPDIVIERYSGIGSNVDEDEVWRATSSNEIDDLKTQNQKLVNEMRTMRTGISTQINKVVSEKTARIQEKLDEEQRAERKRVQDEAIEAKKNALRAENAKAQQVAFATPTPAVTQTPSNEIHVTRRAFERTNPAMDNPGLGSYKGEDLVKERESKLHSISFGVEEINTEAELSQMNQVQQKDVDVQKARNGLSAKDYIPAGTFVRALLLGGIDAPTGGQPEEDPYPVLLEVSELANMPNSFEYDFKSCRVIGSGYGDISSERAIIRLEKISCISSDELIYETRVKGFVYDETGRVGMKGRLVSKQGQMIANGLLAGIGAGIGSAFQESSKSYNTNGTL
jgi:conjugal transfer pilus assembly protein TraB